MDEEEEGSFIVRRVISPLRETRFPLSRYLSSNRTLLIYRENELHDKQVSRGVVHC